MAAGSYQIDRNTTRKKEISCSGALPIKYKIALFIYFHVHPLSLVLSAWGLLDLEFGLLFCLIVCFGEAFPEA